MCTTTCTNLRHSHLTTLTMSTRLVSTFAMFLSKQMECMVRSMWGHTHLLRIAPPKKKFVSSFLNFWIFIIFWPLNICRNEMQSQLEWEKRTTMKSSTTRSISGAKVHFLVLFSKMKKPFSFPPRLWAKDRPATSCKVPTQGHKGSLWGSGQVLWEERERKRERERERRKGEKDQLNVNRAKKDFDSLCSENHVVFSSMSQTINAQRSLTIDLGKVVATGLIRSQKSDQLSNREMVEPSASTLTLRKLLKERRGFWRTFEWIRKVKKSGLPNWSTLWHNFQTKARAPSVMHFSWYCFFFLLCWDLWDSLWE